MHPTLIGISTMMLFMLCGCATQRQVGVKSIGVQPTAGAVFIEPGPMAVQPADLPAKVTIAIGSSRAAYAGEEAANAAQSILDPPNLHDPLLEMAASPFCFVLTPFVAAYGALVTGHQQITGASLADTETEIAGTMNDMARQQVLGDSVRGVLRETMGRRILATDLAQSSAKDSGCAVTLLETKVEELRLERASSSESSYALSIKARARLLRSSDSTVLYDQPFQYQSGTALFVDWGRAGALENVAKTGYREMAEQIATNLRQAAGGGPVMVGAGFKRTSPQPSASSAMVVGNRPGSKAGSIVQVVSYGRGGARVVPVPTPGDERSGRVPPAQLVSYPVADPEMGVYSSELSRPVTLQRPMTKDEAISEAVKDVSWSLDGLQFSRNSVVQLTSMAVAVPWSICKQAVAGVRGVSQKKVDAAEAKLLAAARKPDLQQKVAVHVARELSPRDAQPMYASMQSGMAVSAKPAYQLSAGKGSVGGNESALGVTIVSAALKGDGKINPSLALCVEARATVIRLRDGAEVDSWPVHYRSASRKFTQWAANDARLFRDELKECQQQIGNAIVDHLGGGQIGPEPARQPVWALRR
jgi:hypothetical protein